jgi:DNA-binding transcriptional LysR family regulator
MNNLLEKYLSDGPAPAPFPAVPAGAEKGAVFAQCPLLGGKTPTSNFELYHLRCFVAAAEELHFGRAAARMNMTQPPLSRQIQLLERVVGLKLLDRTTNRAVKLTPAGHVFLLEARRILHQVENATLVTRRFASGEAGTVGLGYTATIGYSVLPRLLPRCGEILPNIHIELKERSSWEQVEGLRTGHIDVGLLRPPITLGEFATLKLGSERLVAALPAGDPRLLQDSVCLKDFDKQPLLMYSKERAPYFHDLLTGLLEGEGIEPVIIHSLDEIHSMLSLVRAQIGPALVPEAAMLLNFENVHFRPLKTRPAMPVKLLAAWRRENDNPALAVFLELLRAVAVDHARSGVPEPD